ncbi:hypothetical protein B0H19DRAFT_1067595 [Mycena capillaripes]|nr:hypothetical protein B0H19DRAFT_1067595 [Mycena capillaripes]
MALARPELWDSVEFRHDSCVEILKLWFSRAGSSPLDYSFNIKLAAWREIALARPELWESVEFGHDCCVEILKLWLSRAGSSPLDYSFNSKLAAWADPAIEIFLPHSHIGRMSHLRTHIVRCENSTWRKDLYLCCGAFR